ncbi:MAG: hypothetical protein U1E53_28450 [Dongiaceae bacterium]
MTTSLLLRSVALTIPMFLTSCVQLEVNRLDHGNATPVDGWAYSLPFARFQVSVVRTYKGCDEKGVKFAVSASSTPLFQADPSQTYSIDNTSLSNWFKTSDFSIGKYDNGMLKSIGATADDLTGKVIVNTLSGAISLTEAAIRTAALGAPTPPAMRAEEAPARNPLRATCNTDLDKTLKQLEAGRRELKAATAKLDTETKRLKLLSDAAATFGTGASDKIQDAVFYQANRVADSQSEVTTKQKAVQDLLNTLSNVDTFEWPDDGVTLSDTHFQADPSWIEQFLTVAPETHAGAGGAVGLRIVPRNNLALEPEPDGKLSQIATGSNGKGIRYRVPVPGALEVKACTLEKIDAPEGQAKGQAGIRCESPGTIAINAFPEGPIPQLGRLMFIPFTNGVFQNNVLKATFGMDGNLLTASYTEVASRAEVASDTFNQVAANLLQASKTLPTAGLDERTAILNAKAKELQAQANLSAAAAALQPSATEQATKAAALIQSDTALKDAQLKNYEASLALSQALAVQQARPSQ